MFPRSIRWRLQLWLGFLLVGILAAFGITAFQLNRANQLQRIDRELERRVMALKAAVSDGRAGGEPRRGPPARRLASRTSRPRPTRPRFAWALGRFVSPNP